MGINVKKCSELGTYGFSAVCDICGIDTVSFDSQEDLNMYLTNTKWHIDPDANTCCGHCIDRMVKKEIMEK